MPLPHFLLLVLGVILAAALTLWAMFSAGIPHAALLLIGLTGAVVLHFSTRSNHQNRDR